MSQTIDRDTREVAALLREAVALSGLSQARFARALSTSPPRLSTYLAGATAPSAVFLVRARRLGRALGCAAAGGLMSAPATAAAMRESLRAGEIEWVWRSLLQGRDHLSLMLTSGEQELLDSWEAAPGSTGAAEWDALLRALAEHEFDQAGLTAPPWTAQPALAAPWVPEHPFLSRERVLAQTPDWLRRRNIHVPARDLATA